MKIRELFTISMILETKIYVYYELHNIFCTQEQLNQLEEERLLNMPQKMFRLTQVIIQSSPVSVDFELLQLSIWIEIIVYGHVLCYKLCILP
jgi:hypothetical protein